MMNEKNLIDLYIKQKRKYQEGLKIGRYEPFDVIHMCVGFLDALEVIGNIDFDMSSKLLSETIIEVFGKDSKQAKYWKHIHEKVQE